LRHAEAAGKDLLHASALTRTTILRHAFAGKLIFILRRTEIGRVPGEVKQSGAANCPGDCWSFTPPNFEDAGSD
jgi:hypothetical protein